MKLLNFSLWLKNYSILFFASTTKYRRKVYHILLNLFLAPILRLERFSVCVCVCVCCVCVYVCEYVCVCVCVCLRSRDSNFYPIATKFGTLVGLVKIYRPSSKMGYVGLIGTLRGHQLKTKILITFRPQVQFLILMYC